MSEMLLYHGSQQIIEKPKFGLGKKYNDYGMGFYCTESMEFAKEWACPIKNDGYANQYALRIDDLNVMHLTNGKFHILNWLAILLANRTFDITSSIAHHAKEYILSNFMPDTADVDVIIGYRADDSYFSFAEDFLNNTISLRDLNHAMRLGTLGEQVVLLSEHAFKCVEFAEYEIADYRTYYYKRIQRDKNARKDYANRKSSIEQLRDDIFVLNIMTEDIQNEDPRLQSIIFE